jgi:hypothetical protein
MKLVLDIGGNKFVMSTEAAAKITEAMAEAEWMEHKYVGKDVSPTNYIDLLSPLIMQDVLKFGALDDATYGALQLVTKLHNEKSK